MCSSDLTRWTSIDRRLISMTLGSTLGILMSRQSGAGLITTQMALKWYVIFSCQVQSFFAFLLLHFFINCTCNVSTHRTTLVYVVHCNICVTELHFSHTPIILVKKEIKGNDLTCILKEGLSRRWEQLCIFWFVWIVIWSVTCVIFTLCFLFLPDEEDDSVAEGDLWWKNV